MKHFIYILIYKLSLIQLDFLYLQSRSVRNFTDEKDFNFELHALKYRQALVKPEHYIVREYSSFNVAVYMRMGVCVLGKVMS